MKLSDRQAYVLANLKRVETLPYKVRIQAPLKRYQLDGVECTSQINGLVVKGLIVEHGRRLELVTETQSPAARQAASLEVVDLIRKTLLGSATGNSSGNSQSQ